MASASERKALALDFLQTVHGAKPQDHYLNVYTLPDHSSRWYQDLEAAADDAKTQTRDCYVGCAWADKDYGRFLRVTRERATGIPGLWQDLDYTGPHHKKPNLPPSRDALESWMAERLLPPSAVVFSGYGLQAYWLLEEPALIQSEQDRQNLTNLGAGWTNTIRGLAALNGWDQDATGDLSRVLRLPGTLNLKDPQDPQLVVSVFLDGPRYTLEALAHWTQETGMNPMASMSNVVVSLPAEIDPTWQPSLNMLEALRDNNPKAAKTWDKKRGTRGPDALPDQSQSGYDLSLASMAVAVGWSDEEVLKLLVAFRVKHKQDLKRMDYYQRTIERAKKTESQAVAIQEVQTVLEDFQEASQIERQEPARRQEAVYAIAAALKVPLQRVVKYKADPKPQYALELSTGTIHVGSIRGLTHQDEFRDHLASISGYLMPRMKEGDWHATAQGLLNVAVEEGMGYEATYAGRCNAWLSSYLESQVILRHQHEIKTGEPPFWLHGERLAVFSSAINRYVRDTLRVNVKHEELGAILLSGGCEALTTVIRIQKIKKGDSGKVIHRALWLLPPEYGNLGRSLEHRNGAAGNIGNLVTEHEVNLEDIVP